MIIALGLGKNHVCMAPSGNIPNLDNFGKAMNKHHYHQNNIYVICVHSL